MESSRPTIRLAFLSLFIATLAGIAQSTNAAAPMPDLEEGFSRPPESTKPWCYWYWLSGHITKEGITKDLESMKRVGIGRAVIGDISRPDIARGPVQDLSEDYYGMLEHAVREGGRIGVDISLFNCPGWSQMGGPWVKPSQSMRYLVSTETRVKGPTVFDEALPLPERYSTSKTTPAPQDAFEEVATIAFPAPEADDDTIARHQPTVTSEPAIAGIEALVDGWLDTKAGFPPPPVVKKGEKSTLTIDIATPEEFTARSLTVYPPSRTLEPDRYKGGAFDAEGELLAENADGTFRSVRTFPYRRASFSESTGPMTRGEVNVSFPAEKAKRFRVVFRDIRLPKDAKETALAEITLSGAARVESVIDQQLGKMCPMIQPPWDYYLWPAQTEAERAGLQVDPAKMVNLTDKVGPDGKLKWDVPEGEWVILRTMMRPTGVPNRPASKEGTGLEVDKMSPTAVTEHYKNYVGKVTRRLPLAERPALKGFIVDSYETGSQNWTPDARERFQKSFGYDPVPWFPVLTGRVVGSAEQSNRFLWDLRRFVADAMAETYRTFGDAGRSEGMQFWLEPYGHYGFPAEYLQLASTGDGVGAEFWLNPKHGQMEVHAARSAAHIYGKKIVSSEAFTGTPSYGFTQDPWAVKGLGDFQQAEGINHFVLHVYIHQPYEKAPGMNSWFGTEFNRHNSWFAHGKEWIDYLRRSHFLLQQGHYAADVAYFIGEDAPKMAAINEPPLPPGYLADDINADVILNRLTVKDGKFVLPDGLSYHLLVLPPLDTMRPAVLAKIRDLIAAGGAVLGRPPKFSPSLQSFPKADEEVRKIAADLWKDGEKERKYGKGLVLQGLTMQEALDRLGVQPDVLGLEKTGLLWTELEGPVVSWTHRTGEEAEIYYLTSQADEEVKAAPSFRSAGRQPELWDPVTGKSRPLAEFREENGRTVVPLEFAPRESYFLVFRKPVHLREGKNFPSFQTISEITTPWEVTFDTKLGGPKGVVRFDRLEDWRARPEPEIANYSGTVIYRNTFDLPAAAKGGPVYLDLGAASSVAKVRVNGREMGTLWCKPWRIDISSAVRKGGNELEVEVVTTWINRLLADEKLPEEQRVTWVASKAIRGQKPMAAGLFGPVRIEKKE